MASAELIFWQTPSITPGAVNLLFGDGAGPVAQVIRYAIYLAAETPAFSGGEWAGSPVAQGFEVARDTSGVQTFSAPAEGLTPSTSYRIAFVLGDDADTLVVSEPWATLAEALVLEIQPTSHGHAADSPALSAGLALVIASATHGHAADNLDLTTTVTSTLAISSAQHTHTAGSLDLTAAAALVSHDAVHAHLADTASFTGEADLEVHGGFHVHSAEAPDAVIGLALTIAHAFHEHVSSGIDLSAALGLAIESALHTHGADEALLTAALNLAVDSAFHEHLGQHLMFVTPVPLVDQLRRSVFLRIARQHAVVRTQDQRVFGRVERSGVFLKGR